MTNATAMTVAWSAKYDPFGVPFAVTVSPVNNQRLPGQWFQLEDGLAYNWHRTYDPTLGRYTQADPLGFVDGPGIYNYVGGSPVMGVDPEGLDIALVVGNGTSGNPFGHVGLGVEGKGAFSFGTGTSLGSNFGDYLGGQAKYRSSTLYWIPTSPSTDQCVADKLADFPLALPKLPAAIQDNCATRTSSALKSCGIKIPVMPFPQMFNGWAKRQNLTPIHLPQK